MCLLLSLLLLLEGHVLLVRRPGADFKAAGGAVVRHTHQPLHLSSVEAVALEGTHPPAVANTRSHFASCGSAPYTRRTRRT